MWQFYPLWLARNNLQIFFRIMRGLKIVKSCFKPTNGCLPLAEADVEDVLPYIVSFTYRSLNRVFMPSSIVTYNGLSSYWQTLFDYTLSPCPLTCRGAVHGPDVTWSHDACVQQTTNCSCSISRQTKCHGVQCCHPQTANFEQSPFEQCGGLMTYMSVRLDTISCVTLIGWAKLLISATQYDMC